MASESKGSSDYPGKVAGLTQGKATRDAFGRTLESLGESMTGVCTVDADVGNSTRTEWFARKYPDRAFNVGIAESNLVSVAGGLASCGKTPVIASFACFLLNNAFDQIRMSVAYPGTNVKMVGTHSGISIGEDGASQMGIEDIGLACSLPGVTVMVASDAVQTAALTKAMLEHDGPVYLRVGRGKVADIYEGDGSEGKHPANFEVGKSCQLRDGSDATIIGTGLMVGAALDAAKLLEDEGINVRVLDLHTIKPIDRDAIEKAARETGCIVTTEEHLHHGGMGAAVAQVVAETHPVPMASVDVGDTYAESGDPMGLLEKYGLTAENIVKAVKSAHSRKA